MKINIQELVAKSKGIVLDETELKYFSADGLLRQIESIPFTEGIIFVMINEEGFKRIIPQYVNKEDLKIIL